MRAMLVVILLEVDQFPLEISAGPEQQAIETLAPYGPNQQFDERMGARHIRHRVRRELSNFQGFVKFATDRLNLHHL